MNRVFLHTAEAKDERESTSLMANAENEQLDASSLTAATNIPHYSLQTTTHQNVTLMQPNLQAPPTTTDRHSLNTGKTILKINGNLTEMTARWTKEERANSRRIVQLKKSRDGETLSVHFEAVPIHERPPNSVCISCIWWEEKSDYYVTKVDTIYLVEELTKAPNRFTVAQKNRLRGVFDRFSPVTVSKKNSHSEFFKTVMAYGRPKPRNIVADFKVFLWSSFETMLKKVVGKYNFMQPGIYNDTEVR
jgi:hypothetical protein